MAGIFPNREPIMRLVGAVLTEQPDEWAVAGSPHHRSLDERVSAHDAAEDGEDDDTEELPVTV